ncbi:SinR family protein [Paracoccus aurantiacus]|uniref:SinR family protein n=1 Tax=Paracoccus aurantiacus TaxID=2599412 RepID=A0A5C6S6S6_9RHOB|nr:SinR family protein [Paracoccus aurantiacus]TXB69751.1 SinR family protein [Paracoccus aurantiacus]
MTTYLVGYDLNREGSNYSEKNKALIELIKDEANGYWHHLDSSWIINSSKTATLLRDRFKTVLDDDDELLVIKVSAPAAWHGFNKSGSDWLVKHIE